MVSNRIWADVHLDVLAQNFQRIRAASRAPRVLCVVKADAYGHGAVAVARRLEREGADYFAVACAAEAMELRRAGVRTPILILGYVGEGEMPLLIQQGVTMTVYDEESAAACSRAAQACGRSARVHGKIDTGMSRLGLDGRQPEQAAQRLARMSRLPGIEMEGAFTHFAVADEKEGKAQTLAQFSYFEQTCRAAQAAGVPLSLCHCANSAAITEYPQTHWDMVRAGIILYGYAPSEEIENLCQVRPAMTLSARVAQVKVLPAGSAVSYGGTARLTKERTVAVVCAGYADGFLRTASGRAQVLLGGSLCPVLGRICMDMCMVDVTDCEQEVSRGDTAVLFGDNPQRLGADALARAAGTIPYECLCAVSRRVPRRYHGLDGHEPE